MIPAISGETIRLAFRADSKCVGEVNAHLDRLAEMSPGLVITVSDGLRSLIARGAESFRQDDARKEEAEDK
jgi:hypothetical protein